MLRPSSLLTCEDTDIPSTQGKSPNREDEQPQPDEDWHSPHEEVTIQDRHPTNRSTSASTSTATSTSASTSTSATTTTNASTSDEFTPASHVTPTPSNPSRREGRESEDSPDCCFGAGGEMGASMLTHDWDNSVVGSPSRWPQSLRGALSILLSSRFPMTLWWGKEFCEFYNDAFIPFLGKKHPSSLGRPGIENWPEVWEIIGPMLEQVVVTGEAIWVPDRLLPIDKGRGTIEEIYFRWSYSPVFLDDGSVGGVFTAVTETTSNIISERQLRVLTELSHRLAEVDTVKGVYDTVADYIEGRCELDLPFANLYALEDDGDRARLIHTIGCSGGRNVWPEIVHLEDERGGDLSNSSNYGDNYSKGRRLGETFKRVIWSGRREQIELEGTWEVEPSTVWNVKPTSCMILPMVQKGQEKVAALLMVGLSPRRILDENYSHFLTLTMGQISTAITNARAHEEERHRAEMLAELDRAKTIFFSNISHEFRTPLTLMLGPLEDVLSRAIQEDTKEQLQLVHRNALRLYKLVNTLLDFSRIEAGRMNAHYEATDVSALTADLASIFRSAAERANLQLHVDTPKFDRQVYVDRDMWEKIVMNLLSNALKYTLEGSITVRLRSAQDDHMLQLCVEDTGVGIPTDELPNMFKRFHRVEQSAGRTHEGTGIGLALVSELVKLHGGNVRVDSSLGNGSAFYVEIPFGYAHLPQEHVTMEPEGQQQMTAMGINPYTRSASWWLASVDIDIDPDLDRANAADEAQLEDELQQQRHGRVPSPLSGSGTSNSTSTSSISMTSMTDLVAATDLDACGMKKAWILLADDNADMRRYVARLLKERFRVMQVANGKQALERMERHKDKIELVLSDVMMPHVDGFALLRHLRTNKDTQTLPVILLSARAGEEARVEGLAAGADAYLVKPFTACELLTVVEATLRMARVRMQAAEREQELRMEADEAKAQMEATLASIRDAFACVDENLRFTYVNENAARLMSRSQEEDPAVSRVEMIGKHMDEWVVDTEDGVLKHEVRKAMERKEEVRFESWVTSHGCWLEHRIYPAQAGGAAMLSTDITGRKKAEERLSILAKAGELLAASVQMDEVLAGMVELPVGCLAQWCIIDAYLGTGMGMQRLSSSNSEPWNWQLKTADGPGEPDATDDDGDGLVFKRSASEEMGRRNSHDERALALCDKEVSLRLMNRDAVFRSGLPEDRILALPLTARGTVFGVWLFVFTQEITSATETDDIVVAKELVRRTSQAMDNLRLLAETEKANQAKDHFLAALSHELRTPLTPALLAAESLRNDKSLPEFVLEHAGMIQESVELEVQLIDDLLDLTKVARGKLQLRTRLVDVHELLNRTIRIVQSEANNKGITLDAQLGATRRCLVGDPARLQQVFWNILKNAVKFTSQGSISVRTCTISKQETVSARKKRLKKHAQRESSGGLKWSVEDGSRVHDPIHLAGGTEDEMESEGFVRIEITDTGIGIEPHVLPHLFRAFEQGGNSITVRFGGLGLGLAISKTLVSMHQGSLSASSDGKGTGATFTIELPVLSEEAAEELLEKERDEERRTANLAREEIHRKSEEEGSDDDHDQQLRVLLVEDNKSTVMILSRLLRQRLGLNVTIAMTMGEAIKAADEQQGRFHVVISDLGLPDGSGLDLVRQLKGKYGVRAIALSGYGMEEDIRKSKEAGFDIHLTKPIDFNALASAIKQIAEVNLPPSPTGPLNSPPTLSESPPSSTSPAISS